MLSAFNLLFIIETNQIDSLSEQRFITVVCSPGFDFTYRARADVLSESEDSSSESTGGGGAGERSTGHPTGAQSESYSILHLSVKSLFAM